MPETGIAVIDWFLAAMNTWGYLIVFGFTVFENLFVVGSFTPGETIVIAGGLVASKDQLALSGVWIASVVGTVLGSNISYWAGRRAGMGAVTAFTERLAATRLGRFFRIDASGIEEIHLHFHTQGAKTVFISRFAVGVKNFVPAVAGATRMPVFWYELYTVLGAVTYTSLMVAIGWFLGQNLGLALKVASTIGWFGLAVMALFVAGIVITRRRLHARRAAKASDE